MPIPKMSFTATRSRNIMLGAFGEVMVLDWGWPKTSIRVRRYTSPKF
jgi:hypothetical protein